MITRREINCFVQTLVLFVTIQHLKHEIEGCEVSFLNWLNFCRQDDGHTTEDQSCQSEVVFDRDVLLVEQVVDEGDEEWVQPPNHRHHTFVEMSQLRVVHRQEREDLVDTEYEAEANVGQQVDRVDPSVFDDVLINPEHHLLAFGSLLPYLSATF